jgi:multicomponent Na+:H+ antiporter subunit G
MDIFLQVIAWTAVVIGTIFSIAGVVGFIRLPDVYTRLHATGKVGIFGVVLLVVAAIILDPATLGKGLVLIVILIISGPAVTHAIARTAQKIGIPVVLSTKVQAETNTSETSNY